jgi:hypothetical protein
MAENNAFQLKKFFTDPRRSGPSATEFKEFWESLSDEEKAYYKSADLR